MKIVVIGGTGLIGSRLVKKLRAHGQEVVAAALVRGEFINHAAIGVWYNPRQCFCQRYEAKLIGDALLPELWQASF